MSILSKATKATDFLESEFFWKVLLCGPSGSGKSTLATTLPGKKLFIDLDDRASSLAGFPDIEIITIRESDKPIDAPTAYKEIDSLVNEIWQAHDKDELPYDSIVLDGLSALTTFAMNEAMSLRTSGGQLIQRGPGDSPSQPHYGPQMRLFARIVNRLRPLRRHVLFTSHFDLFEDKETHVLTYWPKVIGNIRTEIGNWFNETYECKPPVIKDGKPVYAISTLGVGRMQFVKSALNQLGKYWGNPVPINLDDPPVGFERLMAYRKGELKWEGKLEAAKASTSNTIKV